MHELAVRLAGHQPQTAPSPAQNQAARRLAAGFPTAGLAEFAVAGPWWRLDTGGGRLLRFLTPRDLRDGDTSETAT
jgi:phosphohistidine phosphatase